MNLAESFGPIIGLILTPNGPSASKNIVTPNDLDEEVEIAWEVLKVQLIFNLKTWVLHHSLSLP
jgi:hypothetical protein